MKKKWLVAVFYSTKDKILKSWCGKVSYNLTADDATVPENTVCYFFSTHEKVQFNLTHINFSKKVKMAFLDEIKEFVHEGKLYCCGQKEKDSIILKCGKSPVIIDDFIKFAKENNLTVEFV